MKPGKPDRSYTKTYDEQAARRQLLSGNSFGVFIDDTGSPGMPSTPGKLHPERKTWVAVVMPPERIREVLDDIANVIKALQCDLDMNEYHFAEIWSGKGRFRKIPRPERLVVFQLFADIFYIRELPIFVQTFDPETHRAAIASSPQLPKIADCIDLNCHEDAALWFLLVRIRDHILEQRKNDRQRAIAFVDEGLRKPGSAVEIDVFDDVFLDGRLCFASSTSVALLQLADFAAFCLNRSQINNWKDKRDDWEIALLEILSPIALQYKNCSHVVAWPERDGPIVP